MFNARQQLSNVHNKRDTLTKTILIAEAESQRRGCHSNEASNHPQTDPWPLFITDWQTDSLWMLKGSTLVNIWSDLDGSNIQPEDNLYRVWWSAAANCRQSEAAANAEQKRLCTGQAERRDSRRLQQCLASRLQSTADWELCWRMAWRSTDGRRLSAAAAQQHWLTHSRTQSFIHSHRLAQHVLHSRPLVRQFHFILGRRSRRWGLQSTAVFENTHILRFFQI